MRTRPDIRFWFRRSKKAVGQVGDFLGGIYCTITVHGQEAVFTTGIEATRNQWDTHAHRLLGRSADAKQANDLLASLTTEINDLAADLDRQKKPVTARRLSQLLKKKGAPLDMLALFEAFIIESRALVGVEIAGTTVAKFQTRLNKLGAFLKAQKLTDLRPEEFTHNLADKYLHWLLQGGQKRSTANNLLKTVSQVLRWGVRREHLDSNPLQLYKIKGVEAGEIKYLTEGELAHLSAASLAIECLARVRDCFVFQCWTGLAYADLAALDMRSAEYHRQEDGTLRRVLRVRRAKSTTFKGYECVIPLLPEAERILALYNDRLPVPTNQIYNRYLKQVGELCSLPADKMTTHVGRKTAGTLLFNMGVPLPVVSKFLGHANTIITQQLYAKLLDTTVVDAFGMFGAGLLTELPAPLALSAPSVIQLRPAQRLSQKGGAAL